MTQSRAAAEWLRCRWATSFPGLGGTAEQLVSRYTEEARVYHDVRHLRRVLESVDLLRSECSDLDAVELAAWFHDAVCDVRRGDNAEASAALAESLLASYLPGSRLREVVRLVLLTRDHAVQIGDNNGAVLCDADLAVLAGDRAEYDRYVADVRAEYAAVSDIDFRDGRAAVLRRLLDLPSLYSTRLGVDTWERLARANVTRELASLDRQRRR